MTRVEAVASLLLSRSPEWVDGRELAQVGGAYAWRTRVSDARKQLGLRIENRVRTVRDGERTWKVSEYRTVPNGRLF